jgi:hypothetical protein
MVNLIKKGYSCIRFCHRKDFDMAMRYPSKQDWKFGWALFAILFLLLAIFMVSMNLIGSLLVAVPTGLFLWIWFGTSYEVGDRFITYRSGPIWGKIQIKDIREVYRHTYAWSGLRPALSMDCLRIRYSRFNDIFISPQDDESFLKDLKKINPTIVIKG